MIQLFKRFHWGSSSTVVLGAVVFTLAWPSVSASRTWYVKADGSGDAPTIQAGIDSAVAGDVVLVGSGTYQIGEHMHMKNGITVTSESGPYQTKIVPVPGTKPLCAFFCYAIGGAATTVIDGFWIEGFLDYPDWGGPAYGLFFSACGSMIAQNNIIVGNGVGVWGNLDGTVDFRNNTLLGNGIGIEAQCCVFLNCTYNIIWDRIFGGFFALNDVLNMSDIPGSSGSNLSRDPQFCGPLGGNYYLQSDSPCAPANSPWPTVGLIGALPVGCGTVKVESHTWGAIKEMYNE